MGEIDGGSNNADVFELEKRQNHGSEGLLYLYTNLDTCDGRPRTSRFTTTSPPVLRAVLSVSSRQLFYRTVQYRLSKLGFRPMGDAYTHLRGEA